MQWIKDRLAEHSTHEGVIVGVAAAAVLFGGMSITQVVLWGALIWGVCRAIKNG